MENEKNTAVVTVLGKDRVGIIAGIIPTFYAMKKYNNGIF